MKYHNLPQFIHNVTTTALLACNIERTHQLTGVHPGMGRRHTSTCVWWHQSQAPPGQGCRSVHTLLGTPHPPTPQLCAPCHAPDHSELWTCWWSPEGSANTANYISMPKRVYFDNYTYWKAQTDDVNFSHPFYQEKLTNKNAHGTPFFSN